MGMHHCHDRILVSTLPGHGIVGSRLQDVSGFGVNIHHTFHQALQERRDIIQGHRSGPNNNWHEGKVTTVREAFRSRTNYHDRIPKLVATKADRSYNDGPDHSSDSLSNLEPIFEHCYRADSLT